LLQIPDAQVKWNRVKAARKHNARATGLGGGLQLRNHLRHPDRFATQIDIVGAHFGAGHHQRLAMQLVRPHRGNHHLGLCHECAQRYRILGVRLDKCQVGAGQFGAHTLEFGQIAASQGPVWRLTGRQARQVLGDQMAGKAGGAENNDVVGFLHVWVWRAWP